MKFASVYEPSQYEPITYALWEEMGAFRPSGTGKPYSIVMPPPNANGNLHIGHGLTVALEDILARYYRLKGRRTIYIPGADHAGFETWVVYEQALEKIGKSRFDFSRDQLYTQVWDFVEEQRGNMELQLRALGASCDWQYLTFTLDKKVIQTVYQTFKRLWDDGLVYRSEKIVNFCTNHQTSFADIEVIHKDEEGTLWDIAYPLVKGGEIIVSTTRPETMLGDTAVAVNPTDERYQSLVGQAIKLPLTDREVPIIADKYVDKQFGTGAVKITPAHDPNDFEIGQRHNLPTITVIGYDGKILETIEGYQGLPVDKARQKVLADLKEQGFLRGEKKFIHSVGHCYKCDSVIEPLLKEQWFLKVQPLVEKAVENLKANKIKFAPASKKQALIQYFTGLKDWNLSRQIPWGIPIPAFVNQNDPTDWIYDDRVEQRTIVKDGTSYVRDEDTFDTWFSSGQWPFITTDYLEKGELSTFYPLDEMETGHDLLYPWISRMIMLGLYVTATVPFKSVYMHGMVQDEHGKKMSKSKGNVINPMDIIAEYGSDAFRLGIVAARSAGQNQAFSPSKVVAGRNLCNKLWNIARFIQDKIGPDFRPTKDAPTTDNMGEDWIIRELMTARDKLENLVENRRFAKASELVYQTIWNSVADWFIESSKLYTNHQLMAQVLEICLKLIHPFAPFVSETIWQNLSWTDSVLATETWIENLPYDEITAADFEHLKQLISEVRFTTHDLPGNGKYRLLYQNDSLIDDNRDLIKSLAKIPAVEFTDTPTGLRLASAGREAWLDVDANTLANHRANLEKRLHDVQQEINRLNNRLSNSSYVKKAPPHLVEDTRQDLSRHQTLIERLKNELEAMKN
jgi:valyl-tRNA synthetase